MKTPIPRPVRRRRLPVVTVWRVLCWVFWILVAASFIETTVDLIVKMGFWHWAGNVGALIAFCGLCWGSGYSKGRKSR